MTDKEMILAIAKRDGLSKPPHHYRDEVKKEFRKTVSPASVTKSVGSFSSRLQASEPEMLSKAKELLRACFFDTALAGAIIHRVFRSE